MLKHRPHGDKNSHQMDELRSPRKSSPSNLRGQKWQLRVARCHEEWSPCYFRWRVMPWRFSLALPSLMQKLLLNSCMKLYFLIAWQLKTYSLSLATLTATQWICCGVHFCFMPCSARHKTIGAVPPSLFLLREVHRVEERFKANWHSPICSIWASVLIAWT